MNLSNTNLRPSAEVERETGFARMRFFVPDDFFFCRGHFENQPLVPGAVVAEWMFETLELAGAQKPKHLGNLKFRGEICPGDVVTVTAKVDSVGRGLVSVCSGERRCADVVFFE